VCAQRWPPTDSVIRPPQYGWGDSEADCGANANCIDSLSTVGWECECATGYVYDTVTGRTVQDASDYNSDDQVINWCKPEPYSILVSYSTISASLGYGDAENVSFGLWYTQFQQSVSDFVALSFAETVVQGNATNTATSLCPGYEYAVAMGPYINGSMDYAAINVTLQLPSGCTAYSYAYDAPSPRRDDGRATMVQAYQYLGKIYMTWTDDSWNSQSFDVSRLDPVSPTTSLASLSFDAEDAFVLSASLQSLLNVEFTSTLLVSSFTQGATLTSSCSSSSSSAGTTSTCGRGSMAPVAPFDDVSVSDLTPGTSCFYCLTTNNKVPSSPYSWASGISCDNQEFIVAWEAQIIVFVQDGYPTAFFPGGGVTVSWTAYAASTNGSDPSTAETFAATGVEVATGSATTANTGKAYIHVLVTPTDFPTAYLNSSSSVLIAATFAETTVISDPTTSITHSFLCNTPFRQCLAADPATTYATHLSFNEVTLEARDITTVDVTGTITIAGTEYPDIDEYADGCPLAGVQVCLVSAPGGSTSFGCAYTASDGTYSVGVTMGVRALAVLTFNGHTFEAINNAATSDGYLHVASQNIDGVDFKDTSTDVLFVDVAGGSCNVTLASALTVTLTRDAAYCVGSKFHFQASMVASVDPSEPVMRWYATVPATYFEVQFDDTLTNDLETLDGLESSAYVVKQYFLQYYSGDALPTINLTAPDSSASSGTLASPAANAAASSSGTTGNLTHAPNNDPRVLARLVRFEYDPVPTVDVAFYQYGLRIDRPKPACSGGALPPDASAVVVMESVVDASNPISARFTVSQSFWGMGSCAAVAGSIAVQNLLGDQPPDPAVGPVESALLTACQSWCSLTLTAQAASPANASSSGLNITSSSNNATASPSAAPTSSPTTSAFSPNATTLAPTSANLSLLATPEIAKPNLKYFSVQFRGSGFVGEVVTIAALITGHEADPAGDFETIPFVGTPVVVLYDPPGDGSFAWYDNMATTVVMQSRDNDYYVGSTSKYHSQTGGYTWNAVCEGELVMECSTVAIENANFGWVCRAHSHDGRRGAKETDTG